LQEVLERLQALVPFEEVLGAEPLGARQALGERALATMDWDRPVLNYFEVEVREVE
jgi:hypothetical protein